MTGKEWLKIVTLPDNSISVALDNIKSFIEDGGKYNCFDSYISLTNIIPLCTLPANKFYQQVQEIYKNKVVEELQKRKTTDGTGFSFTKAYNGQVLEVARKCTGNCSTCNRENCPEH